MWLPCSLDKRRRMVNRRAFTLIEVLLGVVLLSTLMVSGLLGFRVHQKQLQFNQHRIEATAAAERLLAAWSIQPTGVPMGATGVMDVQRQWWWQTRLIGTREIFGLPILIVRLEVLENLPTPGVVLVSVDFVKPAPNIIPLVSMNENASIQK